MCFSEAVFGLFLLLFFLYTVAVVVVAVDEVEAVQIRAPQHLSKRIGQIYSCHYCYDCHLLAGWLGGFACHWFGLIWLDLAGRLGRFAALC